MFDSIRKRLRSAKNISNQPLEPIASASSTASTAPRKPRLSKSMQHMQVDLPTNELEIVADLERNPVDTNINFRPLPLDEMKRRAERISIDSSTITRPAYGPNMQGLPRTTPPNRKLSIIGDGNCLFRCFSMILTGSERHHELIRTEICNFIEQDENRFFSHQQGLGNLICLQENIFLGPVQAYLSRGMREPGIDMIHWGTDIEVMAFSRLFNINVHIWNPEHYDAPYVTKWNTISPKDPADTNYDALISGGGDHFEFCLSLAVEETAFMELENQQKRSSKSITTQKPLTVQRSSARIAAKNNVVHTIKESQEKIDIHIADKKTAHSVVNNQIQRRQTCKTTKPIHHKPTKKLSDFNLKYKRKNRGNIEELLKSRLPSLYPTKPTNYYCAAFMNTKYTKQPIKHYLGSMNTQCKFEGCEALHFKNEHGRMLHNCCHKGNSSAPQLSFYPNDLARLLLGDDRESGNFREFIRIYNSANRFASFGITKVIELKGRGPEIFKIEGELHHLASSALILDRDLNDDEQEKNPRYGQIFIYDPDTATKFRMQNNEDKGVKEVIMSIIESVLRKYNPYAKNYYTLGELSRKQEEAAAHNPGYVIKAKELHLKKNSKDRRYDLPVTNDDCMAIVETVEGDIPELDLAVHYRHQHETRRLLPNSTHVDPMLFPILFPLGDAGFHLGLKKMQQNKNLSSLQFYSNRIAVREDIDAKKNLLGGKFNPILHGGKLFQEYIVKAYCTVESNNLKFIRDNQSKLRIECYQGIIDYLASTARERGLRCGNLHILPSTFAGGPRDMRQKFYDFIALVRMFGKPDYFITMTCNPNWEEIQENLFRYGEHMQEPADRPDLSAKVFLLKAELLGWLMTKASVLGKVKAFVSVTEFQKRGLPHDHKLYWMEEEYAPHTADDVDKVISAELPDKIKEPELYKIVTSKMIHGPNCNLPGSKSPCLINGVCSKRYPMPFREKTDIRNVKIGPYRRRDNRHEEHFLPNTNVRIHNGWVVPFNKFLSEATDTHVNCEYCQSLGSVRYLCKYLTKGHDRAQALITDKDGVLRYDEIGSFIDGRAITPGEAAWRLGENPLYDMSHTVKPLAIHLEKGQAIFFNEGAEELAIREESTKDTTLTGWFKFNREEYLTYKEYPRNKCHRILYQDFPNHYVWEKKKWHPRQKGGEAVIGSIPPVNPKNKELYWMRNLLTRTPGATHWNDLKTVEEEDENGIIQRVVKSTFYEAAKSRNLVPDDDSEWHRLMKYNELELLPKALRKMFAQIVIFCNLNDAMALWNAFKRPMVEDLVPREVAVDSLPEDHETFYRALQQIELYLREANTSCEKVGLGSIEAQDEVNNYDPIECRRVADSRFANLTIEQRNVIDEAIRLINIRGDRIRCIYVEGPAGTGKTYLYETLIYRLRGLSVDVLVAAWSGIAAILLPDGVTIHSLFGLPLKIDKHVSPRLTLHKKELLKKAKVIILDEASMISSVALYVIDHLLRDIMNKKKLPFGGKLMILGGDFRQTLPVVPGGSKLQILAECIKLDRNYWNMFKKFKLTENKRAKEDPRFAQWLLDLGNGNIPYVTGTEKDSNRSIKLPQECIAQDVVTEIFGRNFGRVNMEEYQQYAVLCLTNEETDATNTDILNRMEGNIFNSYSIDHVDATRGEDYNALQEKYPVEVLNNFKPQGFPPHRLQLKKGCTVMLLRNIRPMDGLCNGTRLEVLDMSEFELKVTNTTRQGLTNQGTITDNLVYTEVLKE